MAETTAIDFRELTPQRTPITTSTGATLELRSIDELTIAERMEVVKLADTDYLTAATPEEAQAQQDKVMRLILVGKKDAIDATTPFERGKVMEAFLAPAVAAAQAMAQAKDSEG